MSNPKRGKKVWYLKNGAKALDLSELPRCQAIAKSTGLPCKRPALKGSSLCGIHAGRYRPGGIKGNRNALKHGLCTEKAKQDRLLVKETLGFIGQLTKTLSAQIRSPENR